MTEKMKPSGIAWIGDVPESWNLIKLKYFSYLKGRIGWQGLTADEFIDEGPYLITGTDFENGRIQFDRSYHISEARYAQAPEIQLQIGDLLVTKDGTVGKMAYVDELPDKASLNSHLLLIRPLEGKYHNRFLFWLMSSSVFTGYTEYSQDGTIMASLSQEKIGNFLAYFPDLEEQCAIADFLDAQCAKIDSVIADIEKQIEALQKYKKSLITEAVTKGLDRSVPMKDSKCKWVSRIPVHWSIKRFKYLLDYITDGSHFSPETVDEGYPYITAADVRGLGLDYQAAKKISNQDFIALQRTGCQPKVGDVLLVKDGATTGRVGMVTSAYPCVVLSSVAILRAPEHMDCRYLRYLLESEFVQSQIQASMAGSAMPRTVLSKIVNYLGIECPKGEQIEICDYLDEKCSNIDGIISLKEKQLEAISQHKQSLIYEYVTGKKRVTEVS